jgi:hypothetical protein
VSQFEIMPHLRSGARSVEGGSMKERDELTGLAKAKQQALARRVLRSARWFQRWADHFHAEMKKQNIEPVEAGDGDKTFTLTREDARTMMMTMYEWAKEIRQFSK